jgi:hypothetical protein
MAPPHHTIERVGADERRSRGDEIAELKRDQRLVFRIRSSHYLAAPSFAKPRIRRTLDDSSVVWLGSSLSEVAAILKRTSEPPHWLKSTSTARASMRDEVLSSNISMSDEVCSLSNSQNPSRMRRIVARAHSHSGREPPQRLSNDGGKNASQGLCGDICRRPSGDGLRCIRCDPSTYRRVCRGMRVRTRLGKARSRCGECERGRTPHRG